jgi:hemerythrin-like domain-containing protein
MDATPSPSLFTTVQCFHHYLDELLHLHQEALLERDAQLALGFWQLHRQMLRLHIELEEEYLLPVLERAVARPAWAASVYRAEHAKILALGDKLTTRLDELQPIGLGRRVLIALLDKQRSYKNVLEHHEEREEKGMLPELDAALDVSELERLNTACGQSWDELYRNQLDTVTQLTGLLDAYGV